MICRLIPIIKLKWLIYYFTYTNADGERKTFIELNKIVEWVNTKLDNDEDAGSGTNQSTLSDWANVTDDNIKQFIIENFSKIKSPYVDGDTNYSLKYSQKWNDIILW